jgi:hypothetical protein
MNSTVCEELVARLTRAMSASPDDDGMILVTPELIGDAVELLTELLESPAA